MADTELVSIITPAYNAAKHIKETIESVIKQTYANWELIIVDDGSNDDTADIVKQFLSDERIFYYYQENGRQGKARNLAISKSKGKYIAFLDSDDLWIDNKLEKQIQILNNKEIDVVYSQGWILVDKGKKVFSESDLKERNTLHGYFSSKKFIHILFRKNPIPILSAVVKKSKIDDVNGFGEELDIQNAEDFQIWLKLADSGCNFFGMSDRLFYYRVHEQQSTYSDIYSSIPTIWSVDKLKLRLVNEKVKHRYMFYMVNKIILRESDNKFRANFNSYIDLYRKPLTRYDMYLFTHILKYFGQTIFKKVMYKFFGNKNLHKAL